MARLRRLNDDRLFLRVVDRSEQLLAKVLAAVLLGVMVVATLQLLVVVTRSLIDPASSWMGESLIGLLGDLLTLLIGLEVLQNITSYLRRGVVQIDLVLLTAMTAVGRKVIVLPPGSENKPQLLIGLGIAVLCLAAAYWLVRASDRFTPVARTELTRSCLEPDPSAPVDGADGR
jgi:uncharacterized membrane protein (DUF373 family)